MAKNWNSISLEKQRIRIKQRKLRQSLGKEYRISASNTIGRLLIAHIKHNQCIGLYYPIHDEVDLIQCAKNLFKLCEVGLPSIKQNTMVFRQWSHSTELVLNRRSIPEPDPEKNRVITPQVIIIPVVGFDKRCHRLGYGGGFYDRFLQSSSAIKIGIAFAAQEVEVLPIEQHDIKMDYIITEHGVINS